jgi:hypothetical protein
LSDQALQRSGQVRLIEVAGLINGVEDRYALLEERRRLAGAFDSPKCTICQSSSSQETPLYRTWRQFFHSTLQCRFDDRLANEQTVTQEPIYKRVCVLGYLRLRG